MIQLAGCTDIIKHGCTLTELKNGAIFYSVNSSTIEILSMSAKVSIAVCTLLATAFTMVFPQPNSVPIGHPPSNIGKTFRVRGVPRGWSRDDLYSFLKGKASSEPNIGSLADEVHGRTQTATLTFQDDSSQLQEILTVKKLKIPLHLLPKRPNRAPSLVFDCDFNGITTLYAPAPEDYRIE
jgi:hypothetical protein